MKKPLLNIKLFGKDHHNYNIYYVYNHEDIYIGNIVKSRIGKFMHWIFCPDNQTYFTNGCLKEIVEFITKLYLKSEIKLGKEVLK